ncbi:MAG: DedA family protein [Gammaproteobacteria bacterium]
MVSQFFHVIATLDKQLHTLIIQYGYWIYPILFTIIFSETGLVIFPFLPGDSLLFAAGALAAIGELNIHGLAGLLIIAAILGNTVNYTLGQWIGPKIFHAKESHWFNPRYLARTHVFYEKHGGKAIFFSRFLPIFRTFVPFVAGIGSMPFTRFSFYNIFSATIWVSFFLYLSYFVGNLPLIKNHFSLIILAIIMVSTIPFVVEVIRIRINKKGK